MKYKVCNKCYRILLLNEDNFYKHKDTKDGFRSACKKCMRAENKIYRENNKERRKEYRKTYYENNKEYEKKCRRAYYKNNKEYEKERNRLYKEANKEHEKEYRKLYNSTIKGKLVFLNSNSKGRFKNYIHDITVEMYEEMMNYFDGKCAYTGLPLDEDNFSFEHVIPNSLDGVHAIYNLLPCHRSANFNKKTKDLLSWYPGTEYYSEERLKRIFSWLEYAYNKYENIK